MELCETIVMHLKIYKVCNGRENRGDKVFVYGKLMKYISACSDIFCRRNEYILSKQAQCIKNTSPLQLY